ncbi:MAG: hypothetical protein WC561_00510 [Candidatus Omnitrophota bacterium]
MMKSRLSLKSLARTGLKLFIIACISCGCNASTKPSFLKEEAPQAIQEICKNEYKLDVKARLVGQTLWIYLPLKNLLSRPDKPEKYTERFIVEKTNIIFRDKRIKADYLIRPIPEKESLQDMSIDKQAAESIFNILQVARRVLFSIDQAHDKAPLFFCIVVADIKNGFEIKEVFYYLDLKKISYGFISQTEYHHRIVQETNISPLIIGDSEGKHLDYTDITEEEFLAAQIQHRIRLKFQKPEVQRNADIDKEILKVIAYTLDAYKYKNLLTLETDNLSSGNRSILNQAALRANSND